MAETGAALSRLSDLAARLLNAGSAQVSVVTDVQHVVGSASLSGGPISDGVPAPEGVCWTVVQTGSVLIVKDAAADERVADLDSVRGGLVGSYLGVPLIDVDGTVVGALCVIDPGPRSWTEHDVELLSELAAPAVAELQLAAVVSAYEDDRLIWQLAVDSAGVGAFDWNIHTDELRWDERLLELFGLDRTTFGGTIGAFSEAVHPGDRDRVAAALQGAVETCGTYEAEYRVVLPGGEVRWIEARGRAIAGADGSALRLVGAAYDTTVVREGEARVARVLESMPAAYYLLDQHWRFSYVNSEAETLLGHPRADLLGGSVWELFPATVGTIFETEYTRAVTTSEPVAFRAYYPPPLDGWYEIRAWPTPDGLAVYFLEVTDQVRAQASLDTAASRAQLAGRVSDALVDTQHLEVALDSLGPLLVPELADWGILTLTTIPGSGWRHGLHNVACLHTDPSLTTMVETYAEQRLQGLDDTSPLATALSGRQATVFAIDPDELRRERQPAPPTSSPAVVPHERLAPTHAAIVPLRARGRTAGALSLYRSRDRGGFNDAELALLADIGTRIALAIDNARLYSQQLDLALGLQHSMLTRPIEVDHLEIAVRYVPAADSAQVGGDWYDSFVQDDQATILVIGDVSGHDTRAAAAMGQIRSLLRGIALESGNGPAQLLSSLDRAMTALDLDTTATSVVARLEQTPAERADGLTELRWSNAGHLPPLVLNDAGTVRPLDDGSRDPLLGYSTAITRSEQVVTLERGSTVFFYTDGLVERRGEDLEVGMQRLREALGDLAPHHPTLEQLCDAVLGRLMADEPDDDVALLAVRLHPEDRPRPPEAGPADTPGHTFTT